LIYSLVTQQGLIIVNQTSVQLASTLSVSN